MVDHRRGELFNGRVIVLLMSRLVYAFCVDGEGDSFDI